MEYSTIAVQVRMGSKVIRKSLTRLAIWLLLGLVALLLTGCNPLVVQEQPSLHAWLAFQAGQTVGQTFLAEDDGLSGVQIYLAPGEPGSGDITLRLKPHPSSAEDLGVARMSIEHITQPGFYRFDFPILQNSRLQSFYYQIEVNGPGSLQVGRAPGNQYTQGALYLDRSPQDAQTVFSLEYAPPQLAFGLLRQSLTWLAGVTAGVFLFIIPGWALLTLFFQSRKRLSILEKIGLSAGIGVAVYPLLLIWTELVGIHWGVWNGWLPGCLAFLYLILNSFRTWRREGFPKPTVDPQSVILAAGSWFVVALILFLRFWVIRGLDVPMWGDSYQHTVMAQLMIDQGGLFRSWMPYSPYSSLSIHFGFSADVAAFAWLTGVNSVKATLMVGQLINAIAVIALYPLALRLSHGNRWAGLGTMILAGLVSAQPAYYVNWGRYAQLASQAILPAALWLVWEAIESIPGMSRNFAVLTTHSLRKTMLLGITVAGMVLCYYRSAFFFGSFSLAMLLCIGLPVWKRDVRIWSRALTWIILAAFCTLLFFAPWLTHMSGSSLAGKVEGGVASGAQPSRVISDYRTWFDVTAYVPAFLLGIGAVAVFLALIQRKWQVAGFGLWILLVSMARAASLLHFPASNMMESFSVIIALYIPIAILAGWLLSQLAVLTERLWGAWTQIGLFSAVLLLAVWSGWQNRDIAKPQFFGMAFRPDLHAMAWIRDHVPEDSLFLVESFISNLDKAASGSDGGWWLALLAQRNSMLPPKYALMNEQPNQPGYTQQVLDFVGALQVNPPNTPEGLQRLCDWGITHVYVGQRQGQACDGCLQLYQPQQLDDDPAFQLIYRMDRVSIYALSPGVCSNFP